MPRPWACDALPDTRTILVAGAGIGGLTAAIALARAGRSVRVIEKAPRLEEVGAGLQLTPNACHVLRALGVLDEVRALAVAPRALRVLQSRSADVLAEMPLGDEVVTRYGAPWLAIHRGDLHAALARAAARDPAISIDLGLACDDVMVTDEGVTLACAEEGRMIPGAALVGADGVWSTVRGRIGDDGRPSFRGRAAWRTTLPREALPAAFDPACLHLWLGPGAHLVHYPVRAGAEINIVAVVTQDRPEYGWSTEGMPSDLARHFAGWHPRALDLIGRANRWLRWALFDRMTWFGPGTGPVTLLGDAAHPVVPFLAQGAALAIEDAAVLAAEVDARGDDLPAAFRAYEAARRDRAARVARTARETGTIYGLPALPAMARDIALRAMSGTGMHARYRWIYGWKPPALPARTARCEEATP